MNNNDFSYRPNSVNAPFHTLHHQQQEILLHRVIKYTSHQTLVHILAKYTDHF